MRNFAQGAFEHFIGTIKQLLDRKVDKETGKELTTNDYSNVDKAEVAKIKDKADKTYVDNKVKTDVPANAKFTDTNLVSSVNNKKGDVKLTSSDIKMSVTDNMSVGTKIDRVVNSVDTKVTKEVGKGLSTNDYTNTDKNKLNGIELGANKYTHPNTHPYSMITGVPSSLPANGGHSTSSKHLIVDDTRSMNYSPAEYMSGGSRYEGRAGWQNEFKSRLSLDNPPRMTGTYVYLQTLTPWSDPSGGYPIQIVYGNGQPCWRIGISRTTWGEWISMAEKYTKDEVNNDQYEFVVKEGIPYLKVI